MAERSVLQQSPAYLVLRASAKRVLAFMGTEIERNGPIVTIYNDQLEALIGSRRLYLPGP